MAGSKWPEELPHKIGAAYNPGPDGIADSFFYVLKADDMDEARRRWSAYPKLVEACKEFVRKCECGETRSVRSYAQMKEALVEAGEISE